MPAIKDRTKKKKLPGQFADLVRAMPPQAIVDDVHYQNTLEMIDRILAGGKLTKGQSAYLETLVQLVQAYEASHHAIDTSDISGIATLRHLMAENEMKASDLARLLGVHISMGSKILKGERALTIDHVKKLAVRFRVNPSIFID